MRNLLKYLVIAFLIECFCLVGFVLVSKTSFANIGKYLFLILFVMAVAVVLAAATRILSMKKLFLLTIFLTISYALFYDILGFLLFPGLVKDIILFSFDHLIGFLLMSICLLVFHISIILLSKLAL